MPRALRLAVVVVLAAVAGGRAEPRRELRPDVDVLVPVEPREHERIWWMHRHDRRLAPPTVSINDEPYVCDADGARFPDRERFVAHLRGVHAVPDDRIRDDVYELDGRVHFAPTLDVPSPAPE